MKKTVVVAIGGNAITQAGQRGTIEEQIQNIEACCDPILDHCTRRFGRSTADRAIHAPVV